MHENIKRGNCLEEAERVVVLYQCTRKEVTELDMVEENPNRAAKWEKIFTIKGKTKNR